MAIPILARHSRILLIRGFDRAITTLPAIKVDVQGADQAGDAVEVVPARALREPFVDTHADERVVEQRGADPDRTCPRDHELQRILGARDPALADDRDAVFTRTTR